MLHARQTLNANRLQTRIASVWTAECKSGGTRMLVFQNELHVSSTGVNRHWNGLIAIMNSETLCKSTVFFAKRLDAKEARVT